jgi:hypothetical protein
VDLAARFLNLAAQQRRTTPSGEQVADQGERADEVVVDERGPVVQAAQYHQLKRISAELIVELAEAYRQGATVPELARRYNINRTTVLDHLERQGVQRRPNVRKMTDDLVRQAIVLYNEGWSYDRLGEHLGISAETIRRELKQAGVVSRPAGRPRRSDSG